MNKIVFAAIAASFAITASSVATAGTPGSDNGQTAKQTGTNSVPYNDPFFGPTNCNETQHRKFDTVSCNLPSPNLGLAGTSGTVGWISDFDHLTYGTFTYTVSADGLNYSGKATYQ